MRYIIIILSLFYEEHTVGTYNQSSMRPSKIYIYAKHILKFWCKFSRLSNVANIFHFLRIKENFDPNILYIYSENMQMIHVFNA